MMRDAGPLRLGLRTVWRQPLLVAAETAWRWTFLLAATGAVVFTVREVLDAVEVSPAELLAARVYRQLLSGIVIARALPLLVRVGALAAPALALLWAAGASVSRAATVGTLVTAQSPQAKIRPHWAGLVSVHLLRALLALCVIVAATGALAIFLSQVPAGEDEQARTAVLLLWLLLALLLWLAWSVVDWFLQLAAIFCVRDRQGMRASTAAALALFQSQPSACLSIAAWFRFSRAAVSGGTICAALILIAVAEVNSAAMYLALVLLLLAYSAASSWLYLARLAAYLWLSSGPVSAAANPVNQAGPLVSG
jgi:hypothetical protein